MYYVFPCAKLTSNYKGHNLKVNHGQPANINFEVRRGFDSQGVVVPIPWNLSTMVNEQSRRN